jgi:hypothetical protein
VLAGAVVVMTACLVAFGAWFLLGLSHAAKDIKVSATATRGALD